MEQIVDYISKLTMSDKLIISELQAELIPDTDWIRSLDRDRNRNDHYYSLIADHIIFRSGSKLFHV